MKITFAESFKSDTVEIQIGDQRFVFERKDAPFEVDDAVGAYCLRLPHFAVVPDEAPASMVEAAVQEVAPRKK